MDCSLSLCLCVCVHAEGKSSHGMITGFLGSVLILQISTHNHLHNTTIVCAELFP